MRGPPARHRHRQSIITRTVELDSTKSALFYVKHGTFLVDFPATIPVFVHRASSPADAFGFGGRGASEWKGKREEDKCGENFTKPVFFLVLHK